MRRLLLVAVPFIVLAGCASDNPPNETATSDKSAPTAGTAPQLGAPMKPPMMQPDISPDEEKKAKEQLDALKGDYDKTKADFAKKPKDAKAKDAFVVAAVKYGHESMMSPALPPKVKYRQALSIYREVLKIDPENEIAGKESKMIIDIYKSMNRPIPE